MLARGWILSAWRAKDPLPGVPGGKIPPYPDPDSHGITEPGIYPGGSGVGPAPRGDDGDSGDGAGKAPSYDAAGEGQALTSAGPITIWPGSSAKGGIICFLFKTSVFPGVKKNGLLSMPKGVRNFPWRIHCISSLARFMEM